MSGPSIRKPDRPPDLIAHLECIPTELGGRHRPINSGYNPNHEFGLSGCNDAQHFLIGRDSLAPGEAGQSEVYLKAPGVNRARLYERMPFTVQEGGRLIARARIETILNLELQRPGASPADFFNEVAVVDFDEFSRLRCQDDTIIIDVRGDYRPKTVVEGARTIAEHRVESDPSSTEPFRANRLIVVCDFGIQSRRAAALLRLRSFKRVAILGGGLADHRGRTWRVGPV